jgi:hypothetical protein
MGFTSDANATGIRTGEFRMMGPYLYAYLDDKGGYGFAYTLEPTEQAGIWSLHWVPPGTTNNAPAGSKFCSLRSY